MNRRDIVYVWQFDHGNQGALSEKGRLLTPVVNVQLLESWTSTVSGTPSVRVGEFAEINGKLREIKRTTNFKYQMPERCVTLASDEELPKTDEKTQFWEPTED